MDYNIILKDLNLTAQKVENWAKQGYVPTLEKDSVLEVLRRIYSQMEGENYTPSKEEEKATVTEANDASKGDELKEYFDTQLDSQLSDKENRIKEFLDFTYSRLDGNLDERFKALMSEIENIKKSIGTPAPDAVPDVKPVVTVPTMETKPVTDIKVDTQMPLSGFYSFPEELRLMIIHDLFDGNVAKAELAVNKMCSLKTIDELLIYIEEHFSWNADSTTAVELISHLSKKYK